MKNPEMKKYGLLGFPLSHSFSKGYFMEKFRKESIDAIYENFALPSITEFPSLIHSTPLLAGLNVTIPYKQAVMPYLDALTPEAEAIGAVNVIRMEHSSDGKAYLTGYNSDLVGFRESIRPLVSALGAGSLKALVLGTGGASKAILYALKQLGIETVLVSRKPAPGQITYDDLTAAHYKEFRILVNTTPLGMSPNVDTCPPIDYSQLGSKHLLFDAIYNPDKTLFLQKGETQGARIKNGLEMLHLQAEAAWEIWNS
jgi:shikimate dehydrogenase